MFIEQSETKTKYDAEVREDFKIKPIEVKPTMLLTNPSIIHMQ